MPELREVGFIGASPIACSLKRYYCELGQISGNAGEKCQSLHSPRRAGGRGERELRLRFGAWMWRGERGRD